MLNAKSLSVLFQQFFTRSRICTAALNVILRIIILEAEKVHFDINKKRATEKTK